MIEIVAWLARLAYLVLAALWFGAMTYSLITVQPKAARFFPRRGAAGGIPGRSRAWQPLAGGRFDRRFGGQRRHGHIDRWRDDFAWVRRRVGIRSVGGGHFRRSVVAALAGPDFRPPGRAAGAPTRPAPPRDHDDHLGRPRLSGGARDQPRLTRPFPVVHPGLDNSYTHV